jgi:hypothetical protein
MGISVSIELDSASYISYEVVLDHVQVRGQPGLFRVTCTERRGQDILLREVMQDTTKQRLGEKLSTLFTRVRMSGKFATYIPKTLRASVLRGLHLQRREMKRRLGKRGIRGDERDELQARQHALTTGILNLDARSWYRPLQPPLRRRVEADVVILTDIANPQPT